MANRHLFRSITLQTLFQWDIREYDNSTLASALQYAVDVHGELPKEEHDQALSLAESVAKKRVVLDEVIEKAAPDWPLEKISIGDRNILRLGLYELLFGDREAVPPKVAINEAIELAKRFGGEKSGKFVNGIIGAVYREIGEPGKEQAARDSYEIPYEEMPIDIKGSAVVYSIDENDVIRIAMVHDVFGYWTLSKGGIEENESIEDGTVREIKEEIDLNVKIIETLGENEYIAYHPERGPIRKHVHYFLAQSDYVHPTLKNDSGGLNDVKWFELSELSDLTIYDDVSKMIIKSIEILTERTGSVPMNE
jgi:N utilization substance protein B